MYGMAKMFKAELAVICCFLMCSGGSNFGSTKSLESDSNIEVLKCTGTSSGIN